MFIDPEDFFDRVDVPSENLDWMWKVLEIGRLNTKKIMLGFHECCKVLILYLWLWYQQDRIKDAVASLEQDTGYKLRVLAQNYPNTPGLAFQ